MTGSEQKRTIFAEFLQNFEMSSQQHLLSLKVLRLSKPNFEIRDNLYESGFDLVDSLSLPVAFGNIYLGETFTSYLCLSNESPTPVADFTFKAELQTGKERFTLADTGTKSLNPTTKTMESLMPHQSAEFMLHHEIKELGIHILVCSVHYQPASLPSTAYSSKDTQKKFFRKFFKFQVLNPLSVKTKLHSMDQGVVYLEIQVQNLATISLDVQRLELKPSSGFRATSLQEPNGEDTSIKDVFGGQLLQPQDIRQYLFILKPSNPQDRLLRSMTDLGYLDISWRTTLGQPGHLETAPLIRKEYPISPVEVTPPEVPPRVEIEKLLKLKFKIHNNLDGQKMDLKMGFLIAKTDPIVIVGSETIHIGLVNGLESTECEVTCLPLQSGIHSIPPIKISDALSSFSVDLSNLGSLYVI